MACRLAAARVDVRIKEGNTESVSEIVNDGPFKGSIADYESAIKELVALDTDRREIFDNLG